MIKINKNKSPIIESDIYCIRPISINDMSFYIDWFSKQFTDEFIESQSQKSIDKMITKKLSVGYTFIYEIDKQCIGEISFYHDKMIKIKEKEIKNPVYILSIIEYKKGVRYDKNKLINLFFQKNKNYIMENINTIITVIDNAQNGFLEAYKNNNFNILAKEKISSKLDKYFEKIGVDNPYLSNPILLKKI